MQATESQRPAIEYDGNLVIFAGPGSGKTATSVQKAIRILKDPANSLLMCTFTRDSAQEMSTRLTKALAAEGVKVSEDRLRVSTLDSVCLWHYKNVVDAKVNLLSPGGTTPRLMQMCNQLKIGKYDDHAKLFDEYQVRIDRTELVSKLEKDAPETLQLINAYYDWLKSCGQLDLATIKRTVALNMANGSIPLFPYTHVVIDEGQDNDELQLLIAIIHGENGVKTTLVADDDQTIYDWRAACGYLGLVKFVEACQAKIVRLGENFRSHSEIVEHASRLIQYNNPNRIDKPQKAIRGPGGRVEAIYQKDIYAEMDWVCAHLKQTLKPPYDCAIISRTNRNLDVAELGLKSIGVDYHRASESIWKRDDIASYIAFMIFMAKGRVAEFSAAVGYLGFTVRSVNALAQQIKSHHIKFRRGVPLNIEGLESEESKVLEDISRCCKKWRANMAEGDEALVLAESMQMYAIWYSQLAAPAKRDGQEHPKVTRLKAGLEYLHHALQRLQGGLIQKLNYLTKSEKKDPESGVVRLMTMHSSKGLEWDTVYIIGASEKEDDNTITAGPSERRVFFVAMTRARKNLFITFGGKKPLFLKEAGVKFVNSEQKLAVDGFSAGDDDTNWDDVDGN